jgi:hypothetical protein
MENELIRFDSRHGYCVRACQTGKKRGCGNKSFRSKIVFGPKVHGVVAGKLKYCPWQVRYHCIHSYYNTISSGYGINIFTPLLRQRSTAHLLK